MKRATMSLATLVLAGCTTMPIPPAPVEPPPAVEVPQVTTRSFLIRGPRFPVGQSANVRVCVDASGAVVSAEVTGSSGESRFDEFAITWARQADVQNWVRKDAKQPSCGNVRVEIGPGFHQRLGSSVDSALG
jgi:TonB family protein